MDAFTFAGSDDDVIIDVNGDVGPVSGTGKGKESKQLRPSTIYLGSSPRHITLLKSLQKKDPKTVTSTLKSLPDLLTSSSPVELRPFLSTFTTLLPNLLSPSANVPVLIQTLKVFKLTLQVVPKMSKLLYEGEVTTCVLELNFHSTKQVKDEERGRRRQYIMRGGKVWKELDFSGFYWGGKGWECTLSDLESVKGQASYSNINYCRLLIEEGRINLGLVKELEKGMRGLILERVIEDRNVCEYVVDHYEDNEDFWALNYSHIKHKVPPLSVCEKAVAHGSFETLLESKKLYPATSFECHDWSTFLSSKSSYSNSYPPSLIHSVIKDNLKSLPPSLIKYLPLDLRSPLILDSLSRLSSTTLKQAYTLPTYSSGDVVLCKRNATVVQGVVKIVHRDSMPLLYYTVVANGTEFQTEKISDLPIWGERPEVEEEYVEGCIERIEEEGATECLRVLMEFYKGRKGLGSLHARIREAILKIDGEKIGKAFLGLGGKWGVGWAKIVDDVEKFVEEVLEKVGRGSNEILGDASFWVGEERLKDIIKSVNLNLKSNAMNVNNFKLGLQHALKVQRSLSRNKFPNITNPDLSAVKSVVKLFVRDPNSMKDVCFEFFKVGKLRDSEFERHIVSSVKSNSDGLLKLLGSNEVGHLAYKFLDVHARLADVKGEDVTDDEFKRIRANVEERFGGWEVEEREEVEEVVQWAVGVLPRGLREVFEGEEGISCVVDSKKPAANQDPEPAAETAEEKIEEMVAKTQTFILLTTYAERSPKTAQYSNFAGDGVDKILNLLASLVEPGLETETWIKCLDFHDADCSSETYLQNLSNLAFLKSLTTRLVKSWYDSVRNKENKLNAEEFVVLRGRKVVVKDEVDNILKAGRAKLGDMNVEGNIASGEITARYMQDECALSVTVILPKTYPLADARIDTANSLEVPGKKWGLALSCMLKAGSCILDALLLWKDNIDCEFTGVEPCPICYAVLDPKTRCVPGLECGTCHTKFHRGCLVKWFAQSGKEACVICQQETVNIGGGRRGKR
ncbi:hypothetical protein TrST_g13539 [Triparma strigata]|uniref:E3 ubiquitin-protein ligase listerin n=1 Tax=Triparma strigata TaxID=1606541 RepID=A0A9W7DS33_9STRA|nr:hypothetical protein TrST_g13539 [Triparma strigata]